MTDGQAKEALLELATELLPTRECEAFHEWASRLRAVVENGLAVERLTAELRAWACSDAAGISSLTIWETLTGLPLYSLEDRDVPRDAGDFKRCLDLLGLAPWWRDRLPEVAARYPGWGPFVREWKRLAVLCITDEQECTAAIRALKDEVMELQGYEKLGPGHWKRRDAMPEEVAPERAEDFETLAPSAHAQFLAGQTIG